MWVNKYELMADALVIQTLEQYDNGKYKSRPNVPSARQCKHHRQLKAGTRSDTKTTKSTGVSEAA